MCCNRNKRKNNEKKLNVLYLKMLQIFFTLFNVLNLLK